MSAPKQDHDDDHLLRILQAQGQKFMSLFSYESSPKKRKRTNDGGKGNSKVSKLSDSEDPDGEEVEWVGIRDNPQDISDNESEGSKNFEQEDDALMASSMGASAPTVVVFSESHKNSSATTKDLKKAFLSSKVSKMGEDVLSSARGHDPNDQSKEDLTNIQNDALLHRLIHTKLLSGSLNPELELSPAERKKALAGRMLELSGRSKLGKGERAIREAERNKAAKRVREGLLDKKKEREKKELEEAKNLGNYHPTLKKLYEQSSSSSISNKMKRERGLRMGVGRFSGGVLKLSREEINTAQGRGRGRGRGKGRSR